MNSIASLFTSHAGKEISRFWNVDDEYDQLQMTYFKFQELMDSVEVSPQRIYGRSNAWQLLFPKLQNLDYEADGLLDYVWLHLSDYCAHHSIASNQKRQLRRMILSSRRELILPHKIAEMQKKLDEIIKETESLINSEMITFNRNTIPFSYLNSISLREQQPAHDRLYDLRCIVNSLNDRSDGSNFSVISIVGMGGIGKTTLAQFAYDVVSFEEKIWVSLSAEFDAIAITRSIIEFATEFDCSFSDLASLQLRLQNILSESEFLIVLDNYCSESYDDWSTLSRPFQSGSQGSKVIVTSRNKKVSQIVCSNEEYFLETLSDDDCWKLIQESAKMDVWLRPIPEPIGMEIAKKCKGVPLVAKKLGNMVLSMSIEERRRFVLERDMWDVLQDNSILFHFMQSYNDLPIHLRKCFAYCSIFPQGYEFEMEELINLWMGEGYVQSSRGLARSYFEDLYLKFFFYEWRPASNPHQIRYKMHDLIHGMAQLVYKDICLHTESNRYPLFGDACHLSLFHDDIQPLQLKASVKNKRLRTFLVMNSHSNAAATTILDPQLFSYLKFLRVLGLGGAGLTELVDSIALLQSLRYLNLTDNPIYHLPKSVCNLVALEILKLRSCPNLHDLPEELSSLINLRHLEFDERVIAVMPPHFRNLVKLEYLSAYTVGKKNGCGIGELQSLDCLFKSLYIGKIEISNTSEAQEARLDLKGYLHKLELEWTRPGEQITQEVWQQMLEQNGVLTALRPHINLEELVITNYLGTTFPSWLSDPSHNLKSIDLNGVKHCDHLPDLGELPCLKFFSISYMPHLESIGCQFYGSKKFPSLEFFQLRGLLVLENWAEANEDDNVKVMPHLHNFKLEYCPILPRLPRRVQECLRPDTIVTHCPGLQP